MSDIWAGIAGAANQYLSEWNTQQEEERWFKKQKFLEELQMQKEQRQAEREAADKAEQRRINESQFEKTFGLEQQKFDASLQQAAVQKALEEERNKSYIDYNRQMISGQEQDRLLNAARAGLVPDKSTQGGYRFEPSLIAPSNFPDPAVQASRVAEYAKKKLGMLRGLDQGTLATISERIAMAKSIEEVDEIINRFAMGQVDNTGKPQGMQFMPPPPRLPR